MADLISKDRRSWNMSRIKGKNTKPEKIVRSILHHLGFRFRIHYKHLPGKPDIVLPKHHTVVLVHGCFWHRHQGCKECTTPKTNTEFWQNKFQQNVQRDQKVVEALEAAGWRVVVVWGCEVKEPEQLSRRLFAEIMGFDSPEAI